MKFIFTYAKRRRRVNAKFLRLQRFPFERQIHKNKQFLRILVKNDQPLIRREADNQIKIVKRLDRAQAVRDETIPRVPS